MGKILGYHHIMFILLSADVAFCYRMLSAATAHEFEPSVQHSRHPTFQPLFFYSVRVLCVRFTGSFQCRSLLFGHLWCICACQALAVMVTGLKRFIHGHDVSDDAVFEDLLCLANSGRIGAAPFAPYCSKHSRTTLRSPGPPPSHVRLIEDIISQPAAEKP